MLGNMMGFRLILRCFYMHRITQKMITQLSDRWRHGGRKQHGLPSSRNLCRNPHHGRVKAQIKHVVGFIKNKIFDRLKADRPAFDQVF